MTDTSLERGTEGLTELDMDWDIACEVPARAQQVGHGTPKCQGDSAAWVGWRVNCCPQSPKYMLVCDICKTTYEQWLSAHAYITCGDCNAHTDGFLRFTELNKAKA